MTDRKRILRRILCGAVYFLPLLFGLLFLLYASKPHLWYIEVTEFDRVAHETLSSAELKEDSLAVCKPILDAPDKASVPNRNFAYAVKVSAVAYDVGIWAYMILSVWTAVCTAVAFALPPTHPYANFAKKLLRFVIPNRICWLLSQLLLFLPALFPHLLAIWYRQFQGVSLRVHFYPFADWLAVLVMLLVSTACYILTLPWQAAEHMDMFRLYKSGSAVPRKGDEVI